MSALQARLAARAISLAGAFTLALLSGCGTYDPPQPGKHAGPGETQPDITCSYEAPTASTFVRLRCDRTQDLKARGEEQRRDVDSVRGGAQIIN